MSGKPPICGLLLAAGRSSRFGRDKLLHPLADGTPIAAASARALRQAMERAVAVVDRRNDPARRLLEDEGLEIVFAPDDDIGLGRSLAAGVAMTADAAGWVVALADMPFILAATVRRVRLALEAGSPLAAPSYDGRRGHPVGFGAGFRPALMSLRGDQGARHLLARHRQELELIECADPAILHDIDRPQDLGFSPAFSLDDQPRA